MFVVTLEDFHVFNFGPDEIQNFISEEVVLEIPVPNQIENKNYMAFGTRTNTTTFYLSLSSCSLSSTQENLP